MIPPARVGSSPPFGFGGLYIGPIYYLIVDQWIHDRTRRGKGNTMELDAGKFRLELMRLLVNCLLIAVTGVRLGRQILSDSDSVLRFKPAGTATPLES